MTPMTDHPVAAALSAVRARIATAADAARQSKSMVVDLVRGPGQAPDGRHARVARTGVDEEALAEAPAADEGRFVVPQILGEGE